MGQNLKSSEVNQQHSNTPSLNLYDTHLCLESNFLSPRTDVPGWWKCCKPLAKASMKKWGRKHGKARGNLDFDLKSAMICWRLNKVKAWKKDLTHWNVKDCKGTSSYRIVQSQIAQVEMSRWIVLLNILKTTLSCYHMHQCSSISLFHPVATICITHSLVQRQLPLSQASSVYTFSVTWEINTNIHEGHSVGQQPVGVTPVAAFDIGPPEDPRKYCSDIWMNLCFLTQTNCVFL